MRPEGRWWEKPLDALDAHEWEALCDGCALCCLHKVEEIDSAQVYFSRVACRLLDIASARCKAYPQRRKKVRNCLDLRVTARRHFSWLPPSCSYRLRHEGKSLPRWHPLVSGDRRVVHGSRRSVCHFALSEGDGHAFDDHLLSSLEDVLENGETK